MLVTDSLLYILIIGTFAFIILYFLRRSKPSWHDESIMYCVMACVCSFFSATIILGQFAEANNGIHISYGAFGLVFYFIAALCGGYAVLQVYLFLRAEVFRPIEDGKLEER